MKAPKFGKPYPLFNTGNIIALNQVILADQFDDIAKSTFVGSYYSDGYASFIQRNLQGPNVLDVGCGSGLSTEFFPEITHMLDASPQRCAEAARRNPTRDVQMGASEALPHNAESMQTVLYLHGFWQARSDYEVLLEVSRVLTLGGRFIFDIPDIRRTNVEFGRLLEPRCYMRVLRDFGFEIVEHRTIDEWDTCFCVEKTEEFNPTKMRKIQVIASSAKENGEDLYRVRNLDVLDYTGR